MQTMHFQAPPTPNLDSTYVLNWFGKEGHTRATISLVHFTPKAPIPPQPFSTDIATSTPVTDPRLHAAQNPVAPDNLSRTTPHSSPNRWLLQSCAGVHTPTQHCLSRLTSATLYENTPAGLYYPTNRPRPADGSFCPSPIAPVCFLNPSDFKG